MTAKERRKDWECWRNTFCLTEDGRQVWAEKKNYCGDFATDRAYIDPVLVAFSHWMDSKLGINREGNIGTMVAKNLEASGFDEEGEEDTV